MLPQHKFKIADVILEPEGDEEQRIRIDYPRDRVVLLHWVKDRWLETEFELSLH
jgi:hypothetical protein